MKKIVIVGAGVSGLAAGIYALQSGFDVSIYEQHFMTGGVCASWTRMGYTFEGAVHWLTDSAPDRPFYRIWEETGILGPDVKMYRNDPYTVLKTDGGSISVYRDIAALRTELMRVSPQDKKAIRMLCSDIKAFTGMAIPVMDLKGVKTARKAQFGIKQMTGMFSAFPKMGRLMKQTVAEYLSAFQHPGIRTILQNLIPDGYCAMALISTLATFSNNGHFPEGGALELGKRMMKRFTDLGGKLYLSSPVQKVMVKDNKATGIIVKGKEISADAVIVTRDILSAECLFDQPPADSWIAELKSNCKPQLSTFIGIGVKVDLSDLPYQIHFPLNEPFEFAGVKHETLGFSNYSSYENYAPAGGTSLTICFIEDNYDWWKQVRQDGRYDEEKARLAAYVKKALESEFPRMKDKIEVIDIATPLTYERYTGSYKGSWMSFMPANPKIGVCPQTCKDIESVYFAGFRMQNPGGLPVALSSGRSAAQLICRQFDTVFQGRL